MTGVPFLLIVLVGIAVFYSYMIMRPSEAPLPPGGPSIQREGFSLLSGASGLNGPKAHEGFQSNGAGCNPKIVPMSPPLVAGSEPTLKPGALVSAPYNQIASTAPTYYRDPAQETASRERIITTAAQLRAFLSFEAPLMRALSDPAVQLPLQQSKADLPRVEQELYFLQQNPGVQSQLKVKDLDEVDSNVAYLQRSFRTSVNTGVIQRPVSFQDSGVSVLRNLVKRATEGFVGEDIATIADLRNAIEREVNASLSKLGTKTNNNFTSVPARNLKSAADELIGLMYSLPSEIPRPYTSVAVDSHANDIKSIFDQGLSNFTNEGTNTAAQRIRAKIATINREIALPALGPGPVTAGPASAPSAPVPSASAPSASASFAPVPSASSIIMPEEQPADRATTTDLQNAVQRLTAEMMRLTASGTNDPETNQRVAQINFAYENINGILEQLQQGTMSESEIPIRKDELDALFASSGDFNMPLGELTTTALPANMQNLLPSGLARDSESQQIVSQLADKYMDAFLKGTSFQFNLGIGGKYTSDNEAAAANKMNIVNVNFPQGRLAGVDSAFAPLAPPAQPTAAQTTPSASNLTSASQAPDLMPMPGQGTPTDPFAYDPRNRAYGSFAANQASGFDWKERAKTICENARKRGLNPAEFGCLPDGAKVSADFSWRGYAKMICNRLQTDYYTGVPEACGCPPMSWPGWK